MAARVKRKSSPKKKKTTKKDACYHKVKRAYTKNGGTWPSAYGSGALVKCRKVGAKNWGKRVGQLKMAKPLSKKQKKIAQVAPPKNKITGADFSKLRKRKTNGGKKKV